MAHYALYSFVHFNCIDICSLETIFSLWDILLCQSPKLTIFIAISYLVSLRADILKKDFNDCIIFFSDLPPFDLQSCIPTALEMLKDTPETILHFNDTIVKLDTFQNRKKDLSPLILQQDIKGIESTSVFIDCRSSSKYLSCNTVDSLIIISHCP